MNSVRLSITAFFLTFFLPVKTFAHDTPVHQYVVKQAYYFLENEKGVLPELRDRIGLDFYGPGNTDYPWETGYIGVGAWSEDLHDPIWGYGGPGDGWSPTSTHFWDADNGDDVMTPIDLSHSVENAYYKARIYLFGGHRIFYKQHVFDPYYGEILGRYYSYNSIIELYRTGRYYDEGFMDLAGNPHILSPIELYMNIEPARKMAAQILGRVAHLLTDMSLPAHTHNDLHYDDGDEYENWMGAHYWEGFYELPYIDPIYWNAWNAARQGPLLDVYQAVHTNDWTRQIRYLFYTTNQIADRFPSDDSNGDNVYSTNYNGDNYNILNLISEITHSYNAGSVQPYQVNQYSFRYCIRAVAGLFYWFACETGIISKITAQNNFVNGTIKVGIDNEPTEEISPAVLGALTGQTINLEAQNQTYDGIERKWNISGVPSSISRWQKKIGTSISDLPNGGDNYYSFPVTLSDDNSIYLANLMKNCKISVNHQTEFDGSQTDQSVKYIVELNSDTISTSTTKPLNGRTYNFAGWKDGNGDNPRTIYQPTDNQTYTALYKIPQRSNAGAYTNNSQRKIVRSDDGKLHMVYESMGYIWYERSTNSGTTWQIMNGGKPIDSNPGKAPSIDILYQPENYQSEIYIVYQTYTSTTNDVAAIKVAYFLETQLQYVNTVYVDDYYYRDYTSISFNPVVSKMLAGRILVAWEDYNIYYKIGNQITGGFSWSSTTSAGNSSGTEKFPTIAAYKVLPNGVFHLAWQDNYSTIYYRSYTLQQNGTFSVSSITNVSQGCGYPTNYAPSINVSSSNQVYLVWVGSPYYGSSTRKTISRLKTTSWSSSFGQYGDKVLSPGAAFGGSNSIIAWSENPSGSTYTNKFLKYGSVKTAGTTGKDMQVFNADNLTNMFISSFNSNALPYYFSQSANLNSINKEGAITFASGVQAVAYNGKVEYYLRVGDISVNGTSVDFKESEAPEDKISINDLNKDLITNEFTFSGNDKLTFSVEYGVTDSLLALNQLSDDKSISFKIELVDKSNDKVIMEINKFTLDKKNVASQISNTYDYAVNGLEGKQVTIRVKLINNFKSDYATAVIKADKSVLPKSSVININLSGPLTISEYSLEQNYPNPFNPTTTINYQIKEDGLVTLKLFDVLGEEITTLVNELKNKGRYTYTFDGSDLPSGVYVYQLQVNDFVSSKKLMLLK